MTLADAVGKQLSWLDGRDREAGPGKTNPEVATWHPPAFLSRPGMRKRRSRARFRQVNAMPSSLAKLLSAILLFYSVCSFLQSWANLPSSHKKHLSLREGKL